MDYFHNVIVGCLQRTLVDVRAWRVARPPQPKPRRWDGRILVHGPKEGAIVEFVHCFDGSGSEATGAENRPAPAEKF
jgi:hypothetical protein